MLCNTSHRIWEFAKEVWSIFVHNNDILCILAMFLDAVICSKLPFYSEILLAVNN